MRYRQKPERRRQIVAAGNRVRVLSVDLGRTATAMQETLFKEASRAYLSAKLLQPEDVATIVLCALALPPTAEVTDITNRPAKKA